MGTETKSNWKFERPIGLCDLENFSHSDPCWNDTHMVCGVFHMLFVNDQQVSFKPATIIKMVAKEKASSGFCSQGMASLLVVGVGGLILHRTTERIQRTNEFFLESGPVWV
jgi:hypothetical protein